MKALIGRKVGMTQIYQGERGKAVPVTLVQAGPCVITQVRSLQKDGYSAIQIGFGEAKNIKKPQLGHLKPTKAKSAVLREIRLDNEQKSISETEQTEYKVGDVLDVGQFETGEKIKVTATSKGKGFAGTIKRWNFHRGPKTHGSDNYRQPGSIGSMYPQRVLKGKKMAGRMGHDTVTIKNLSIAEIDNEQNILAISGAIPGPNKSVVIIKGL